MDAPFLPKAQGRQEAKGPKWRRRSDARPDEILDAALLEFTEKGFEPARMEDVARRAGLSKAGVYLYFESKEALLKALVETRVAPIAQMARGLAQAGMANPRAALEALIRAIIARISDAQNLAVPRLILSVAARFPDVAQHYRANVVEVARGALEALIARGVECGQFRNIDPSAAARAFIGPIFFEAMWTHILQGESGFTAPDRLAAAQLDVLFNGIAAPEQEKRA